MVCPMIEMSVGVKGQTRNLQAIKWPLHPENRTSLCVMQVFHHNQTLQLVIEEDSLDFILFWLIAFLTEIIGIFLIL